MAATLQASSDPHLCKERLVRQPGSSKLQARAQAPPSLWGTASEEAGGRGTQALLCPPLQGASREAGFPAMQEGGSARGPHHRGTRGRQRTELGSNGAQGQMGQYHVWG